MSNRIARFAWQLPLLVSVLGLGAGCFTTTTDSGYHPSSNTTGGSASTYVPPTCDQGCQDYLVAWAIDDTIWFLWNQKLAGHPVGVQDVSGACPLGGTVHITGMDSVADGTTTTNIVFEFDACEYSDQLFDLTFTGSVNMDGSFNGTSMITAEVFSSTELQVKGSLDYLDDPAIDEGCEVTFSQQGSGDSSELAGRRCGRSFDEGSLKRSSSGGTGQAGSGGSGSNTAGSSSGNDCACFCPNGSDCTGAKTPNPCGVDSDGIPEPCACPVDCK
jgi:hypothetical protein